jgi:DNA polymerase II small subunit
MADHEVNIPADIIEQLFERGILANKEILESEVTEEVLGKIELESDLLVLNTDYMDVLSQQSTLVDWYEVDRTRVEAEKERNDDLYQEQLQHLKKATLVLADSATGVSQQQEVSSLEMVLDTGEEGGQFTTSAEVQQEPEISKTAELATTHLASVEVTLTYNNIPHKYGIQDFANFFHSRYRFLEALLRNRQELQHTLTINRLLDKKERESAAIIGLVQDVAETKTGNILLTLEDPTGSIKVLISKSKKELFADGKDIVLDEVIGIAGMAGDRFLFADKVIWPDVPITHEFKKGPEDEYALFLSDIHVGSKLFLREEFKKFIQWVRGEVGNDQQRETAKKVKYIFIAGDVVDGVGIYPSQEEELELTDIKDQYADFCELIREIPLDKQIIICPGNHDSVHLAEPQPAFYQEFSPGMFDVPNVTLVSNPSMITIGKTDDFSGFDVLMYHGYSFDYYVANVESIRMNGGYHRADLIMKFLLKRRHLAPSFKSTPYYPSHKEDPLLIRTIPDFLVTGHIHYCSVANYKGITTISGSCWQDKTTFQEKLGHEPEPARVPIVNLKTREIKILRFG